MNLHKYTALLVLIFLTACVSPTTVVQPLPNDAKGQLTVQKVDVKYGSTIVYKLEEFDANVAAKRAGEGLPPANLETKPSQDEYALLPFNQMLANVILDTMAENELVGDRQVEINVTVDTLKFISVGMVMLIGDSDQLTGSVVVNDVQTGEKLSEYYIDILKPSAGLLGLMIRGAGMREQLANNFAISIAKQLTE